jgi:hypothetical protein
MHPLVLELPPKQWPATTCRVQLSMFANGAVGHLTAGDLGLPMSADKSRTQAWNEFQHILHSTSSTLTDESLLKRLASTYPAVPPYSMTIQHQ